VGRQDIGYNICDGLLNLSVLEQNGGCNGRDGLQ
jgi:hypothetical protein